MPEAYSYGFQLLALQQLAKYIREDGKAVVLDLNLVLSITESVKDARDHNLNCRRDPHDTSPHVR